MVRDNIETHVWRDCVRRERQPPVGRKTKLQFFQAGRAPARQHIEDGVVICRFGCEVTRTTVAHERMHLPGKTRFKN